MIEALEVRQLLTTLYGGGAGLDRTYFYATDGATTPNARIDIYGNVTAEFIFMHGITGQIANRTVGNGNTLGLNVFTDSTTATGSDIFAIYVSQSDINSYISVSSINPTNRALTTFGGGQGFDIDPDNPRGADISAGVPSGIGSLLLGAQTGGTINNAIIKTDINGAAIGVRPAGLDDLPDDPNNDLSAGLRVANGHDLGKFLFDGEVYGKVHVDGSMNLFYAGWILTGDARGASEGFGPSGYPTSQEDNFTTTADTAAGEFSHIVPKQNFYIGGDLQTLATIGPLGWDGTFGTAGNLAPFYITGTDVYVRGRLGNVQANDGDAATITAANIDPSVAGFTRPTVIQEELEGFGAPPSSGVANDFTNGFPNTPTSDITGGLPYLPGASPIVPFSNNTFNSFQFLGTFNSSNGNDIIDVVGSIDTNPPAADFDPNDYYGVALLAGQTVNVELQTFETHDAHVGVFDPDGRLIATDYDNLATPVGGSGSRSEYTYNVPFQFTADRPGIYRFAIGMNGDINFNNFVGASLKTIGPDYYELTITNSGVTAIGGIHIGASAGSTAATGSEEMLDINDVPPVVQSLNGDVGGIYVAGLMYVISGRDLFENQSPTAPGGVTEQFQYGSFNIINGNLRALDTASLGLIGTGRTGPDLSVPNGSVGLVQTRSAADILEINPSIPLNFDNNLNGQSNGPSSALPLTLLQVAIGGSYQVINSAGDFMGGVVARGGMGTLRAADITGPSGDQPYIYLDADNSGFDGKSDLIDISGDVVIGPALYHGPGGNFRYFRVGGFVDIDSEFGVSNAGYVAHNYGESVYFTDDSGSSIYISPVGPRIANPLFNVNDPTSGPQFFLPQLSTLAYPVRTGGEIVMDVQSTGSVAIYTQAGSIGGTAEISRIEVHGNGTAPLVTTRRSGTGFTTTLTEPFNSQVLGTALTVSITGSAITDVAYIAGLTPEPGNSFFTSPNSTLVLGNLIPVLTSTVTTFSNITSITNNTGGEILSVNAANLGTISSTGPIGITRTTTIAGNSLNFIDPISIGTGYAARGTDGAGNAPVNPTGTVIGSAFPFDDQTFGIAIGGNIVSVVSTRGLGNIIATGIIGSIVANSDGKDVAGVTEGINAPIFADAPTSAALANTSFGYPNGSILSVSIGEGMGSAGSGDFARTGIFAGNVIGSITGKNADIRGDIVFGQTLGSINLTNGSLIDANIINVFDNAMGSVRETSGPGTLIFITNSGIVRNIGAINISGNGGMIGTLIAATSIGPINVGGFGIISSEILTGFATSGITTINAGGYGIRDSIISSGNNISSINVTGNGSNLSTNKVSASVRESETVRADPVLLYGFDPYSGRALTALNDIHAALGTSQASPIIKGVTDTGVIEDTKITSQRAIGTVTAQTIRSELGTDGLPLSQIIAGNSIDTIKTRGLINGLKVVTGRINNFLPASDVLALHMSISGPLNNIKINGTLGAGSVIEATGPNGTLGNVSIKKNLKGTLHATQSAGTITIGGNLSGAILIDALKRGGLALQRLQIGGTITTGLLIVGAARNIASVGQIIIGKGLGSSAADSLQISGSVDRLQVGGIINASITVKRGINTLQAGRINSPIHTANIQNLIITHGGLHGALNIGNQLVNASIHGSITANISANNGIGTITVYNGSVAAGTTIQSGFGPIGTLNIHGDLDGSVIANGKIGTILVGGNVGDGTTPLDINGTRLDLLQVGGSIRNGVTVDITGPIDNLTVAGDIDDGAIIEATALHHHKFGGQVFGSLLIG